MKTEIHWKGVTGSPADYECADGEQAGVLNLWMDEGDLKPVFPPLVQFKFPKGLEVRYVHKTKQMFRHVIFEDAAAKKFYWCDYPSEVGAVVSTDDLTEMSEMDYSELYEVNSVNNTLLVLTDSGIHHYLWKEDGYKYLGTHIPELPIQFGLQGQLGVDMQRAEGELDAYYGDNHHFQDIDAVTLQVFARLNKFVQESGREHNKFTLPFLVRYAYRLYDGNLTMHSAPVLMMTSSPHVLVTTPHDMAFASSYEYRQVMAAGMLHDLVYDVMTEASRTALQDWKDIVKSVDVFVSAPIYTYDQSGKVEQMDLVIDEDNTPHGMTDYMLSKVTDSVGTDMEPSEEEERKWQLDGYGVYSIDQMIRMTLWGNKESAYTPDWVRRSDIVIPEHPTTEASINSCRIGYVKLPWYSRETVADRLKDIHTFYLLKSIPVEELPESGIQTKVNMRDKYLVTLEECEVMTDEYMSHDILSAKGSYVYNSRMHYYNTQRTLYSDYSYSLLTSLSLSAEGNNLLRYGTRPFNIGSFERYPGSPNPMEYTVYRYYDVGELVGRVAAYRVAAYYDHDGEEKILTDGKDHYGLRPVNTEPQKADATTHKLTADVSTSFFAPIWYMYMPERNIKRVLIREQNLTEEFEINGEPTIYVFDNVRPHEMLNGSLQINASAIGSAAGTWEPQTTGEEFPQRSQDLTVEDGDNVVYVSEAGNPFMFKPSNIQTIATGRTIAFAAAVRPLSEGQFGQYPLYAFTTEGVYALSTNKDGTYGSVDAVTRDICTGKESIVQLDTSVVFAADRGVMQLEGIRAVCITDILGHGRPFRPVGTYGEAYKMPKLSEVITANNGFSNDHINQVRITEYMKGVRMSYDYTNQRLILFHPGIAYAYVYSIKDKAFGMMENRLDYPITSYPEAYAVMQPEGEERDFVDMTKLDMSARVKGFAVSRPLKMGSGDMMKTVNTLILRGVLDSKYNVMQVLYGSRDLVYWYPVFSSNDIYLRGFRGTPYKYFRLVMLTELGEGESLYGSTIQWEGRIDNQPR